MIVSFSILLSSPQSIMAVAFCCCWLNHQKTNRSRDCSSVIRLSDTLNSGVGGGSPGAISSFEGTSSTALAFSLLLPTGNYNMAAADDVVAAAAAVAAFVGIRNEADSILGKFAPGI